MCKVKHALNGINLVLSTICLCICARQEKNKEEQTDVGQIPQFCEYSVRKKSTV